MHSAILLVYLLHRFYKLRFINSGFPLSSKYLHKPALNDKQKLEVPYNTHESDARFFLSSNGIPISFGTTNILLTWDVSVRKMKDGGGINICKGHKGKRKAGINK